jgi:hypothetical protein
VIKLNIEKVSKMPQATSMALREASVIFKLHPSLNSLASSLSVSSHLLFSMQQLFGALITVPANYSKKKKLFRLNSASQQNFDYIPFK